MRRRFTQHETRQVQDLDGIWDFAFLGNVDADAVDPAAIEYDDRMAVPGCFDATPGYAGERGLAAYRRTVHFSDTTPHRLILDAVHHWGRVLLNGRAIGEHVTGFVPWGIDVTPEAPGAAELVVLVDNRFDYQRVPTHLEYFDWYHFGGIARGAELHRLGASWIDAVRFVTEDHAAGTLKLTVRYGANTAGEAPLRIQFAGRVVADEPLELTAGGGELTYSFEAGDAGRWSPEAPNLHELYVTLGEDDLRERVGIRQIEIRGKDILCNGQPLQLVGFCRHEAHPQFGHTVPETVMVADIQQLREMGCNFVRGSHYPQDGRFLDLCDETGICVWNETIAWQPKAEHLNDERFMAAQIANANAMVASSVNHPSVFCWGVFNEGHSHEPACRDGYAKLLGHLRELDPTRPVTYACNHPHDDVCLDLADFIAINCYPGWYHGTIEEIPHHLDRIVASLAEKGQGDKPLIFSEIGAGAIYGWRDWNETRWTEQYQAKLLEMVIRTMFMDRSDICGLSIWQFCDIRTAQDPNRAIKRPRAFNNKGVLDEYRRPKPAYDVVKRLFAELGK